jgi:hypothetical protein
MRRIVFASMVFLPLAAQSQAAEIPGRDLLAFPIALTAEAPALGVQTGTGLWNPATAWLGDSASWRISAASMSAPADISLSAQVGAIAGKWRHTTFGLTVLYAEVANLLHTDSDPQSVGNEIPYYTMVISALAARRISPHLIVGVAIRSRSGQSDNVSRTGLSADVGLVGEHLTPLDARVGLSTFLLHAGPAGSERTSFMAAVDARVFGDDSLRTIRAGYSLQNTQSLSTEQYLYGSARWKTWEVRGGPVQTEIYGTTNWRMRFGIAVHYEGYAVGVAREESANGLAPTYQFTLRTVLK